MMPKIYIDAVDDRLDVASVLVKNKYTVRQGSEKTPGKKASRYFIEYWPNDYDAATGEAMQAAEDVSTPTTIGFLAGAT